MSGIPAPAARHGTLAACVAGLCAALSAVAATTPPMDGTTVTGARAGGARTSSLALLQDSARLWRQRGRDDLSRAALLKILAIDPHHQEALRLLAAIDIEAERFDEAGDWVGGLERAAPGSADAADLRALLESARTRGVSEVRARLRAIGGAPPPAPRFAAGPRTTPSKPRRRPVSDADATTDAPSVAAEAATAPAAPDPEAMARDRRAAADALLAAGDEAGARAALEEAVRLDPRSAWARFDLARLQQRQGDTAGARATIAAGLALAPEDPDMAYAAALFYAGIDADDEARAALARIERERWSEGMVRLDRRLHIAALLASARGHADAGRRAAARADLDELTTLAADDASVLVRAGWIANSIGDHARARGYFARAAATGGAAGDEVAAAERGIDHVESQRQRFVTSGIEYSDKPGDAGISRLERRIVPVELRYAVDYGRHLFAHADHLDLSAGRLNLSDYAAATRYGQLLAGGPPGPGGSRRQSASGVMFGAGYEDAHWRVDAGHLPTSFPVSYAVGGLRYEATNRGIAWSAELARRPVTSTLISFAGVRDPVSGERWGGARRTGVTLRAARDFRGREASARLALNAIDGRNIADNTEIELRLGYDLYARVRENSRFSVGGAVTWWDFKRNQRFQTFGHGGYYSPQSYLSLAMPVQWSGTRGRWSWRTRASVAWSTTHEDDALYHPTDAALQAAAAAQAAANGFASPVHAGGGGGGFSATAAALVEYRISEAWSIGARAEIDRSEDYAPDTIGLWVRYRFNRRGTLYGVPRPPRVYAYY